MPRKGENIYKRKDGRWEGRYIKSRSSLGKALYGYVYSKSYRDIKVKLAQAISTNNCTEKDNSPSNGVKPFGSYATTWLSIRRAQFKESTANKYKNLLNSYILPIMGETPMEEMTYDYIESYCNELLCTGGAKGTGLSPKTVSDILSLIRNIFRSAANSGASIACDADSITIKQTSKEMRVLNRSEQERLCQYLYANLNSSNVGILVCLFTGLRIGEVCALRWEDISISEHTLHVHQTMQRIQCSDLSGKKTKIVITTPKSNCSIRTIPLPDCLMEVLQKHEHPSAGYLLTGNMDSFIEPRTMQNHFKRILDSCAISDANYHSLRHTFATRCVELGFDIKSLSEILGHANVTITMNRYVHPSIELKRNNMERLSTLFAVR